MNIDNFKDYGKCYNNDVSKDERKSENIRGSRFIDSSLDIEGLFITIQ